MTISYARVGYCGGAAIGAILFVFVWLLPSAYFSGAFGSLLNTLLGIPQGVLSAILMGLGILLAGAVCMAGGAFTGWLGGTVIDAIKSKGKAIVAAQEYHFAKSKGQPNTLIAETAEEK